LSGRRGEITIVKGPSYKKGYRGFVLDRKENICYRKLKEVGYGR